MSAKRASGVDNFIASRVRMERMRRGLSQTELGVQLGVTFQQVQKYEKGTNRICAGRLFDIAGVFDIPVELLFPPKATPNPSSQKAPPVDELAELLVTADGRRLCRAFLQLKDAALRARIIALVEALVAGDDAAPNAQDPKVQ